MYYIASYRLPILYKSNKAIHVRIVLAIYAQQLSMQL